MEKTPLISICIPVYNRLKPLEYTVPSLLKQVEEDGQGLFEVVISINPAEDGQEVVTHYVKDLAMRYEMNVNINSRNIGGDLNIVKSIECAKGRFVWVIGDDDLILPGTIKKIVGILQAHKDVTWIFINSARLAGAIEDETTRILTPKANKVKDGFFQDGKEEIKKIYKKIGGGLLFSTSNIYLKSSVEEIGKQYPNQCYQLAFTFHSASKGAAYIIAEPCILAGGNTTWGNRSADVQVRRMNDDLLALVGNAYSRKEVYGIIRNRMMHMSLGTWFVILRLILKGEQMGITALKKLVRIMPVSCLFVMLFLPLIAVYLVVRHQYREFQRRRECEKYKHLENARKEILERII